MTTFELPLRNPLRVIESFYLKKNKVPPKPVPIFKEQKQKKPILILDSNKISAKLWVSMFDRIQHHVLPLKCSKPCWWCRHPFPTMPIGIPLKYKDREEDEKVRKRMEEYLRKANLPTKAEYFETEGIFCSFPCAKAYIIDEVKKGKKLKYSSSITLLSLLYQKLTGEPVVQIPSAPSWKLTSSYGGHLSPEEFRETFGKLAFVEMCSIGRPLMLCCGSIFEERSNEI